MWNLFEPLFKKELKKNTSSQIDSDPLRAELFSGDHLAHHATEIAQLYHIEKRIGVDLLLPRLTSNESVLHDTQELLNQVIEDNRRIAPAGEWLLDNFYLIEEQIRTARRHLPEGYSRELPHLVNGPFEGYPRVYHLARELIAHSDGRIDNENLIRFIEAYQRVSPLLLGELWAVPIMFRLSLIENLRRIADILSVNTHDSDLAGYWVERMTNVAREDPSSLILVIADMARSDPVMSSAFVAEISRHLHGQSGILTFPLSWIEQRLAENNQTIELMVTAENHAQAVDQVSIGNSIGSLRLLDKIDWREFVERLSHVEQILSQDPTDEYGSMDFETRDRYRHVVEEIAKKGGISESEVASQAVRTAQECRERADKNPREWHVGYYLIDEGRNSLEDRLSITSSLLERIKKSAFKYLFPEYLLGIASVTFIILLYGYFHLSSYGLFIALPLIILLLFPVSQGAIALMNWFIPLILNPVSLPKMDYSAGIPDDRRTIVVIPTVLSCTADVAGLLDSIEIRYLANRDNNLYFAFLTDLRNASQPEMPDDDEVVNLLETGIEGLNQKYQSENPGRFFLIHRSRTWNKGEGLWMGYERKRGILHVFSLLLSGIHTDQISRIVGDQEILKTIRYVITLDTDTRLPRNSARSLIGAIAHPLSRPVPDPLTRVIRTGYGILQPRVALSHSDSGISRFAALFGGELGIDPYTRAVSDVYQDAFHEGSFIGKGIYDLEEFSRSVKGRFPENLILSHDLLEGCYARSGLVSDIQVFEEYPISYLADIKRRHRWIRGDWQIIPWLLPFVTNVSWRWEKNPLSFLSRWKIFDNLRRSLVAPTTLIFLLFSWFLLSDSLFWTGYVLSLYLIPPAVVSIWKIALKPSEQIWRLHLEDMTGFVKSHLFIPLVTLTFLPYEAYVSLDAIFRSCWRMCISHKKLLEWTTYQECGRTAQVGVAVTCQTMWPGPVIGVVLLMLMLTQVLAFSPHIVLFALAWIISPAIAWWISQPIPARTPGLTPDQNRSLRLYARKTWRFFETFLTAEDHYLFPDNYQENPVKTVAHRTSPTNIGLSLLAGLTAYDLGYISLPDLIERTDLTLSGMKQLKRFRGHFFNWYDTITLEPLFPRFISTVDSGNLVADVLVLRQGLNEISSNQILSPAFADGLSDALSLLVEALETSSDGSIDATSSHQKAITDIREYSSQMPVSIPEGLIYFSTIHELFSGILSFCSAHSSEDVRWWALSVHRQITSHEIFFNLCTSWASHGNPPSSIRDEVPDDLAPVFSQFSEAVTSLQSRIPTVGEIAGISRDMQPLMALLDPWICYSPEEIPSSESGRQWAYQTIEGLVSSSARAEELLRSVSSQGDLCVDFADIEYEFLYDQSSKLLSIGYNVTDLRRDPVFYDLLASEARITSFIGIAYGKLPQEHWFALGRLLTLVGGRKPALISWSGSMFEYLMPLLLMPTYENSLLGRSYHAVVERQIEYGHTRHVPWGISESGYNGTDANLNYQYRAFGVPGLGFKRGLIDDLVIAPYAAAMGLMVNPVKAFVNLKKMDVLGYSGTYGFFEAVDFTPSRTPPGKKSAIVRSYMAHHQGMVLLSLAYVLLNRPMQRRFEMDPCFQATVMLLQEKMPRNTPFSPHCGNDEVIHKITEEYKPLQRIFQTANTPRPEVNLLSNGRYHVMISNSGSGYSRWNDLAVTRWRADPTSDRSGTFCYIRDLESGEFWSNAYQPTRKKPETYLTIFKQSRAEFQRRDQKFDTRTEIIVSPEDDVELRRIRVTNRSCTSRTIEFTSYAEVVLASQASDESHPAFSNLFVQTELIREKNGIIATRRPRSDTDYQPYFLHLMTVTGNLVRNISFETDRSRFIGRGNTLSRPIAMTDSSTLSDTSGCVLDPIVAIRCTITLHPQETAGVNIFSGMSESRDGAIALIEKYYDGYIADRVSELAWTHAQVMMRQINSTERDTQVFCALASSVIYANPSRRASQGVLQKNNRGQSGLWGYGISGDVPIVLVRIQDRERISLITEMVQAHAYWRQKGLVVDLVIWNEDQSGYRQALQDEIIRLIPQGTDSQLLSSKGGIFIRQLEQMSDEDRILIKTVARAIITDRHGSLADQMERTGWIEVPVPRLLPTRIEYSERREEPRFSVDELQFFNGFGGFSQDGSEYVIITSQDKVTPAPWVNVLANENFGTVISESGSAYTWGENAHEFRLTPWLNDPVQDLTGEAIYIRDEETGAFWSPTPLPVRGVNPYVTRHGFGYSVFEYLGHGIASVLTVSVSEDLPVKFLTLRIKNQSGRLRQLSITGYVEWVLGELQSKTHLHVVTEIDSISGAIFAKNPYNDDFPGRIAFFDSNILNRTVTCDRYEFIGRNGSLTHPAAMEQLHLSNKVGAGLDPCGAIQIFCELADGEVREIIFTLGVGRDIDDARSLVLQHRGVGSAHTALEKVKEHWVRILGAVHISTPDPSLDLLVNGWLVYQIISSRLWARSGFYQSGGAYGFRDQLQDVMAIMHTRPDLSRKHLLLSAQHQFTEGDVQHWWHPPTNRGVRTHCSDDYLWLVYSTCRYVDCTRDTGVLDEELPFLSGRILLPEEESYYELPNHQCESGTLYEHCIRAIRNGLKFGEHGLPLMGSGDWNDGMNLVGVLGKGESVWLGFFMYDILRRFEIIADHYGDTVFSQFCSANALTLQENLEKGGWDGAWYRRAFFDSGEPLGSFENTECMIDSISQSWGVLSGAACRVRAHASMESVSERLIDYGSHLIPLLTPPFDRSGSNPGYIRGYAPGVRENGGQYTHAAIWVVMAFASLKDHGKVWELLPFINPIHHSKTPEMVRIYRVEPYALAADIYAAPPHTGRGGWTWYTGSAGWMVRLILESLLGLHMNGEVLTFDPCIPDTWKTYQIDYQYRSTWYHFTIDNSGTGLSVTSVVIDGIEQADLGIHLVDDLKDHQVHIRLGDGEDDKERS